MALLENEFGIAEVPYTPHGTPRDSPQRVASSLVRKIFRIHQVQGMSLSIA